MAKNLVYPDGWRLELTVPPGTKSGDPVVVGELTGVALIDRQADGKATVDLHGVYALEVKGYAGSANKAISVGDPVYFDESATPKLNANSAKTLFGYAYEEVASGATATIPVILKR